VENKSEKPVFKNPFTIVLIKIMTSWLQLTKDSIAGEKEGHENGFGKVNPIPKFAKESAPVVKNRTLVGFRVDDVELLKSPQAFRWKIPRQGILQKITFAVYVNIPNASVDVALVTLGSLLNRIEIRSKSTVLFTIHNETLMDFKVNLQTFREGFDADVGYAIKPGVPSGNAYWGCYFLPFPIFCHPDYFLDTKFVEDLEMHAFVGFPVSHLTNDTYSDVFRFLEPRFHFLETTMTVQRNRFTNYGVKKVWDCFLEPPHLFTFPDSAGYGADGTFNTQEIKLTCPYNIYKTVIYMVPEGAYLGAPTGSLGVGALKAPPPETVTPHGVVVQDGNVEYFNLPTKGDWVEHMVANGELGGPPESGLHSSVAGNHGYDDNTPYFQYSLGYSPLHNYQTRPGHIIQRGYEHMGFLPLHAMSDPILKITARRNDNGTNDLAYVIMHYYHKFLHVNPDTGKVDTSVAF
jgi:hypothetical protein